MLLVFYGVKIRLQYINIPIYFFVIKKNEYIIYVIKINRMALSKFDLLCPELMYLIASFQDFNEQYLCVAIWPKRYSCKAGIGCNVCFRIPNDLGPWKWDFAQNDKDGFICSDDCESRYLRRLVDDQDDEEDEEDIFTTLCAEEGGLLVRYVDPKDSVDYRVAKLWRYGRPLVVRTYVVGAAPSTGTLFDSIPSQSSSDL